MKKCLKLIDFILTKIWSFVLHFLLSISFSSESFSQEPACHVNPLCRFTVDGGIMSFTLRECQCEKLNHLIIRP